MLKIMNCGPEEFKRRIKTKHIFIYGAGRTFESSYQNYFSEDDVVAIVDKDSNKWGKVIYNDTFEIEISGIDVLINYAKKEGLQDSILFITSQFYAVEIVDELDKIPELDGLECYLHFLIRNTREELVDFKFTEGKRLIPKIFHYIWFGKKEFPNEFKKNIETWKKFNSDYEIVRWDESNYNLDKNDFVREAYAAGKWTKVANYVRADILYEHGGIYLDTDVEVIKSFDCLLNDEAFFCLGNQDSVNNGCGMGSVVGNEVIKAIKDGFEDIHFDIDKGGVGMKSAHNFMDPPLKKYGFVMENRYQKINGVVLYPKEVLAPLTFGKLPTFFTEKTLSIHHEVGSWKKDIEKEGVKSLERFIEARL